MKNIFSLCLALIFAGVYELQAFDGDNSNLLEDTKIAKVDSAGVEKSDTDKDFSFKTTTWKKTNRFTNNLSKNIYSGFTAKKTSILQEDLLFESPTFKITKAYPNPASEVASMDYNMLDNIRAKITIRNLLGKVIREFDLQKSEKQIKIPTIQFDAGVYFYTLSINGKALKAKKLIVDHR